jgi:eukaryotic-like serine/threonine-protein kinase
MSTILPKGAGSPSPSMITRVDEACDRFEEDWKAGLRPRIEEYLEVTPEPERSLLLRELLVLEIAYRRRQGERPTPEEYRARSPEHVNPIDQIVGETDPTESLNGPGPTLTYRPKGESSEPQGSCTQASETAVDKTNWPEVAGYEILAELGHGGMGVVYQSRQRRLDRLVALKTIRAGPQASPEGLTRFRFEAEAVARLHHANIVQIYDIGEVGGLPYLSLELLEGGSLADRLAGTPQPGRQAAELVHTLALAMHTAHQAGIVHRDLKPSNILFDRDGIPKITDFGLAKRLEVEGGETRTGQVMGTPSYMAPEQAQGRIKEVGPAADVYALGAILYEMLTGRPPFKGTTPSETAWQVVYEEPVSPSRLVSRVPRDLETICLKCLAKEPPRRYTSAAALADDLRRFLAGQTILARRTPAWERGAKWGRRHPTTATLLVLGVAACITTAAAGLYFDARRQAEARHENHRVENLRGEIDRTLFRAQATLAEKRWTDSKLILTNLKTILEREPRLTALLRRVEGLLAQAEDGLRSDEALRQDRERYRLFLQRCDQAFFHDTQFTGLDLPVNLQATRDAARAALGVFAVLGPGESWTLPAPPNSLSAPEQAQIAEGCYELLLVLAEAIAQPRPGEDPKHQAERGLRLLDQAARWRPEPTRAYHLRRAACLARAGDAAGEARARAEAERLRPTTALDHFLAGQARFKRGDWSAALREFEEALRLQPDHFWAQCLSAICALQTSRPAEAKVGLNVCIRREPDLVWLYLLRSFASGQAAVLAQNASKAFPNQAADLQAGAEIQFDAAEADYLKALELLEHRPSPELHYVLLANRGLMRFQRGRLDDAVADFREAIRRNDRQNQAFVGLAQVLQRQKKWDEAVVQFTRAIALKPGWSPLYRGRADVSYKRDHPTPEHRAAALRDLEEAIRHESPGSPVLASDHVQRADLLRRSHHYDEALSACDAALKVRPDHGDAHRLRAMVLLDLRRYDDVIGSCDGALAQGRPWADLYEIRGLARAGRHDFARAVEDYTQALMLRPHQPRVLIERGLAYLVSDAPRLALHDFDVALRLDPSSSEAHGGRGLALVRLGDHRAAIVEVEVSLRPGPPTAHLTYNAARTYAQAATVVALEARERGGLAVMLAERYQDRAVMLTQEMLERLPSDRRATFWRDQIQADPALRPLQRRLRSLQPARIRIAVAETE